MLFATSVRGIFRNMILLTYSIAPVRDQVNSDANDSKKIYTPHVSRQRGRPLLLPSSHPLSHRLDAIEEQNHCPAG